MIEATELKCELKKRGYSISQFSFLIKVTQGNLSNAINGKTAFFPAWRKKICEVLEMSEEELFPRLIMKEDN